METNLLYQRIHQHLKTDAWLKLNWTKLGPRPPRRESVISGRTASAFTSSQSDAERGHKNVPLFDLCFLTHSTSVLIPARAPALTLRRLVSNAATPSALLPSFLELSSKNRGGDVECDACASVKTLQPRSDPSSCDYDEST